MTTPAADRAFLDTNILLAATDEARREHKQAQAVLNGWPATGVTLYTSGQIMREYLAVATRSPQNNGLGLPPSAAVGNVRALRQRLHLLTEDHKVSDLLLDLVEEVDCSGKKVHDANIVATMLVHGIQTVVTINDSDFERFDHYVDVVTLAS